MSVSNTMTFFPRLSTFLSTLVALHLVACTEPKAPTLVGRWEALSGPLGYAHVTLVLDSVADNVIGYVPDEFKQLEGAIAFEPSAGSAAVAMRGGAFQPPGGIHDFDHIVLEIDGLSEVSSTKENCDGDDLIDPTQPLCAEFGRTAFSGALRDGRLIGSFDATSCADMPSGLGPCSAIVLSGTITFVRR